MRNIVLILTLFLFVSTQCKQIIIKTGKILLKKKDVIIYRTQKNLNEDNSYSFDRIEKVINGTIYFNYYDDTLVVKIAQYVPLIFQGFKKLKSDTLIITNLPLTSYVPIDTISAYSVKYYNKDSIDKSTERRHKSMPENSIKFSGKQKQIIINKVRYTPLVISEHYNEMSWSCSPGKKASSREVSGIRKYYTIQI